MNQDIVALDKRIYELIEKGNVEEAITWCNELLDEGKQKECVFVYPRLAQAYMRIGEYHSSFKYINEGLEIAQLYEDEIVEARMYNIIACHHIIQETISSTTKEILERALEISKKYNQKELMMGSYNNLAIFYTMKQEYTKALEYLENITISTEEILDYRISNILAAGYIGKGQIYFEQKDYEKTREYWEKSLEISSEYHLIRYLGITHMHLADLYKQLKFYKKAIFHVDKALEIQIELGDKHEESSCYKKISNLYELLEDYKNALVFQKLYIELKESILKLQISN